MISLLTGTIAFKSADEIIIDVNGVGYSVFVSHFTLNHLPKIGEQTTLHIYTHVTEGALSLFGFNLSQEKNLFKKLISVSGVGPKMARNVLSGLAPDQLITAIMNENVEALKRISGVGKKTAERIVVDLKDKVIEIANQSNLEKMLHEPETHTRNTTYESVLSALINLGYHQSTAEKTLAQIAIASDAKVEDILKTTLTRLAK